MPGTSTVRAHFANARRPVPCGRVRRGRHRSLVLSKRYGAMTRWLALWWAPLNHPGAAVLGDERAMRSITLRNYRCFGDEPQTVRLAPLTLLVGENSTGKTSFMAMIRALWDVAYDNREPDFKEEPYDLGSFDEIAHHRGARGSRAESFEANFETVGLRSAKNGSSDPIRFSVTFGEQWSAPSVVERKVETADYRISHLRAYEDREIVEISTPRGAWQCSLPDSRPGARTTAGSASLVPLESLIRRMDFQRRHGEGDDWNVAPLEDSPAMADSDFSDLFSHVLRRWLGRPTTRDQGWRRPFASAPVRSAPRRTYDPTQTATDPGGVNLPSDLAQLASRDPEAWKKLQERLETFGHRAGLFDNIRVRNLGKTDTDPFQIQVRKFAGRFKGPWRNLADVGYGVSQILPVATALLRLERPSTLLLQQPEVHLHPSAQAELGSLCCDVARPTRRGGPFRLIIETHSDFIIDRVRMAVADPESGIHPEDVSIVYFERNGLEVRLHSILVDALGNIDGAPQGYRQFFLEELQRSVSY